MYEKKIEERVSIRLLSLEDTDNIVKWRNTPSVKVNLYSQEVLKPEQHVAYYNSVIKTGKCVQFIIAVEKNREIKDIGTIFIKNIDNENHNGEFGMFIGEESERGKGYAQIAIKQILRYGFEILRMNRIYLTVMENNANAIHVYQKVGFVKEGVLREQYFRNGVFFNVIVMSALRDEWELQNGLCKNG